MNKNFFPHKIGSAIALLVGIWIGGAGGIVMNMLVFSWISESNLMEGFMRIQWLQFMGVIIGMLLFVLGSILPTLQFHAQVFKGDSRLSLFIRGLIGGCGFGMVIFYAFLK